MKILGMLLATICCATPAPAQGPKMTKERVTQLGGQILQSKAEPYRGNFLVDHPVYSAKEGIWRFQPTGPLLLSFPEAPLYFFEVRDADGSYRIGELSGQGYHPRSSEHFRPGPGMKKNVAKGK